jgi:hypothetical protein
MVELARENDIPLMVTRHSLFVASGLLWEGASGADRSPVAMAAKFIPNQELLFELTVADVMRSDVITVSPDQPWAIARAAAGPPDLGHARWSRRRLVGIISIEDLIGWLNSGGGPTAPSATHDAAIRSA